jgi:hypothetical protein
MILMYFWNKLRERLIRNGIHSEKTIDNWKSRKCGFYSLGFNLGPFSGKISNKPSLTSPWMTISLSPVTDKPQDNLLTKNLDASSKSVPKVDNPLTTVTDIFFPRGN